MPLYQFETCNIMAKLRPGKRERGESEHANLFLELVNEHPGVLRIVDGKVDHWANTCVTIAEQSPQWLITRIACADHLDGNTGTKGPVGF